MVGLSILWFAIIAVLMTGFLFLEGFDFGVGVLVPFVGKTDEERRIAIGTIGPVWDGNEVWLLTAGGAMFAAFPYWYATMFSGFYLALFLVLVCLIVRGVTFEFRNKVCSRRWRDNWDKALSVSSFLVAVLFPVAFANLIGGTPIAQVGGHLDFIGGFFDLLTPYTLLAGLAGCAFFLYHGSVYLTLKATGPVLERSIALGRKLGLASVILGVLFGILCAVQKGFGKPVSAVFLVVALLMVVASFGLFQKKAYGKALILNGLALVAVMGALFTGLFPYVMISSINPEFNLSIQNASSSPYTLKIMTIVTVILLPFVLGYQFWSYRVFRHRVGAGSAKY